MAQTMGNAFYGRGLAVHDTIIDCGECHRVRFVHKSDLLTESPGGRRTEAPGRHPSHDATGDCGGDAK